MEAARSGLVLLVTLVAMAACGTDRDAACQALGLRYDPVARACRCPEATTSVCADGGSCVCVATDAGPVDAGAQDGNTDANVACGELDHCPGVAECVDLDRDQSHCGSCARECDDDRRCIDGECIDAVVQVSVGATHACAARASGAVVCWGSNDFGQLGDGSTRRSSTPVSVAGLDEPVTFVAAAMEKTTCALYRSGAVACWGRNHTGQLGRGGSEDPDPHPDPRAVVGLEDARGLSAGGQHICAIRESGALVCWGGNAYAQLGVGDVEGPRTTPTAVMNGVTRVSAGAGHTCAITSDARAHCWGWNVHGNIGDGGPYGFSEGRTRPTPVADITDVTQIAAIGPSSCALSSTGLTCWGSNAEGQLAQGVVGSPMLSTRPLPVALEGVATLGIGGALHLCALLDGGRVTCWGDNRNGQLGDDSVITRGAPAEVVLPSTATYVGMGFGSTCAALSDGGVMCWGSNDEGQLGDGSTMDRRSPVRVLGIP